jgi:endonuclease-3 related protein
MFDRKKTLLDLYSRLYHAFGPRHWWPGDSPFEVAVGAILTQNTSWRNVTKAINNLKAAGLLSPDALYHLPVQDMAAVIRPAGYYNIKARCLKHFVEFLFLENGGDLDCLLTEPLDTLRNKLLYQRPLTASSYMPAIGRHLLWTPTPGESFSGTG